MNESDPRSDVHYLGSSENKAWKKFRPVRPEDWQKIDKTNELRTLPFSPTTSFAIAEILETFN